MGSRLAPSMTEVGQPFPEAGTARQENGGNRFGYALQMALVFGLDPLTQLGHQLTMEERCFHESRYELGNFLASHGTPRLVSLSYVENLGTATLSRVFCTTKGRSLHFDDLLFHERSPNFAEND